MRIPKATYRIQFKPDFGFRKASGIISYLADLGISDIYASPIFHARQGSEHGYDIVNPEEINPELGSAKDFSELTNKVRTLRLGWLQDMVPNHMAFDAQNPFLADILENGPASAFIGYFDIDWDHYYEGIRGKVLTPFLGSFYGQALEAAELKLGYTETGFAVNYYDQHFPLKIESYLTILAEAIPSLLHDLGEDHPDYMQLLGVLYILKTLRREIDNGERHDQVKFIKHTLWSLYDKNPAIQRAIDTALRFFNGRRGEPESFNALEAILADQWFRLSFWKVATEEINYRRFFSINDLISVRVEDEDVFVPTHAMALRLLRDGQFTGFRIDHIDGLYDPSAYLRRLRKEAPSTYMVVEKILDWQEPLADWPVQGTTGYDFMHALNGVCCQTDNEKAMSRLYRGFTGARQSFQDLAYEKKKLIIKRHMFGDVNNLAHLLKNIASRHRYASDITMDSLKQAIIEVLALFPVYRTYLAPDEIRQFDYRIIEETVALARERNPDLLNELDYLGRVLLLQLEEFLPAEERPQWLHFTMRFQQFSGPIMAKGLEDTVLYNYNRLLSLNDVGGNPEMFGLSLEEFHAFNRTRREFWPHSLNASTTHDTKRSEDVRSRLNVLSEIPQEWGRQVRNWNSINRSLKRTVKRHKAPDKNDEYFLYQTLVGAFPCDNENDPDFLPRIRDYMVKAVREAKVHTAWIKPDNAYEEAFLSFIDKLLTPYRNNAFLQDFLPFQRKVAHFGMLNSLTQTLIKMTAPGIPDFYQGTEFWDLSLVDPDNRRPIDYARRKSSLREIRKQAVNDLQGLIAELLANMENGRIKQFLIYQALSARNRNPLLFQEGDYLPLEASGPGKEHVIAYARMHNKIHAITVAPRYLAGWLQEGELPLGHDVWQETFLNLPMSGQAGWQDVLSGAHLAGETKIAIGTILQRFPVSLLLDAGH
ncbi:MAG: malto-oligosyltrehalose synthase [Desulfuromonadales bacterium]|nr:malto-oligosyltrehalose synthase [Desulfuromonadales bacterium]